MQIIDNVPKDTKSKVLVYVHLAPDQAIRHGRSSLQTLVFQVLLPACDHAAGLQLIPSADSHQHAADHAHARNAPDPGAWLQTVASEVAEIEGPAGAPIQGPVPIVLCQMLGWATPQASQAA